jgi:predicted DsbA family dithiol-disulfide isomerase
MSDVKGLNNMKIEFWLDYLCPACYIQHKTIENMLIHYDIHDLEIVYRSYEMVEDQQLDISQTYTAFIAHYKKLDLDQTKDFLDQNHIDINLFRIHDVHRVAHLAKKQKKSRIFNQLVFKAIYEDQLNLSNHMRLKNISIEAGLDEKDVEAVLSSNLYDSQVISNRENAQLKGIYELPFLRINGEIKLKGLQTEQDLVNALNQSFISFKETEFCEGEHCVRKKRQ